jgi:TP901 family phage tail tape measure protein
MTMAVQSFADSPGQGAEINRSVNVDFNSDVSGFTQGVNQATAAVQQLTGALGAASQHADSLAKAVGTKLAHFTIGDFSSLAAAGAVAARFEHQLGTLSATATITGASMSQMRSQLTGVFQQFPVWREQVVALATAINNMGVARPKDVGTLTASYTKLGAATGEDPTALASSGIALAKQMGNLDAGRIDKYNNSLVTLSKTAGVSAQSITDFASALAPFARQAGIGEAAVLGISTAFQKAGADGAVAANAFNQLLSTITTLKQTGGDVSKYSSFLGMTQQQFRSTSTLSAAQQIFQGVAAGGPRAAVFSQDLGGLRAQGAIQRVAQSGDLSSMINLSQASSGNTGNLDRSSKAAFDGLTDSMTGLRNEFTELATLIGGPLITPVKDLVNVVSGAVHGINNFVGALGPVVPALGVLAGSVATVAAVGLAHQGLGLAVGGIRYAAGRNAGWRVAGRAGREVSDAVATGGMAPDAAMMINETGRRIQAGEDVPWHMRQAFNMGMKMPTLPPGGSGGVWDQVKGAFAGGRAGVYAGSGKLADWLTTTNNQQVNPRIVGATSPWNPAGRLAPGTPALPGTEGWANALKNVAHYPFMLSGTLGAGLAAGAGGLAERMPDTPMGAMGRLGLGAVGAGGRVWQGISKVSSVVGGAMMNPLVMAGMGVGLPLAAAGINFAKQGYEMPRDVSESLSGQSHIDQALDETSTNLASFGNATTAATDRLKELANVPVKDLTTVTGSDISTATAGGYQLTDPNVKNIAAYGDKNAILSYLGTRGFNAGDVGGDRFQALKEDLLNVKGGAGAGAVTDIMTSFANQLQQPGGIGASWSGAPLATLAGKGDYKGSMGSLVTGLQAGTQGYGDAGSKAMLANMVQAGALSLGTPGIGQKQDIGSFGGYLQQAYGVDPAKFESAMRDAQKKYGTGTSVWGPAGQAIDVPFANSKESGQAVVEAMSQMAPIQDMMKRYGWTTKDLQGFATSGMALPTSLTTPDQDIARLSQQGELGKAMAGSAAVVKANASPDNVAQQATGASAMLSSALDLAGANKGAGESIGTAAQAANDLREEAAKAGGTIGDMANQAADAADNLAKIASITMTPAQAGIQTVQGASDAFAALTPDSSKEQVAAAGSKIGDAQTAVTDQISRNRQMMDTLKGFNTQMIRATQDYNTQVDQTNLAFSNQQSRANLSYQRSVTRTNRDFGIQTQRAEYQNNLQRGRSTEDFNISQGRATKQYDLQRTREITAANLQVTRETRDFHTNQARETQDYQTQTARSNQAYNLGVAREEEDFHTSQMRASEDYNTSRARQLEDYHTQVSRSTRDFNTSQARAQEDFNTQMARQAEQAAQNVYDPWTRIQRKATSSAGGLLKNLTNQNASLARQIAELAQAKQLGLSEQTIQQLDLANPANAQQLDTLIKTLKRNPSQAGQINSQIATRVSQTKTLTQTTDSLSYKDALEDFQKQSTRATQDFQKSMSDGAADLTKSLTRNYEDFTKQTLRAQQDEDKQLRRGAQDHQTELTQSEQDYEKNMTREAADFEKTLKDQSTDLQTSLKNEAIDFTTQMQNSQDDFDRQMARMQTDFETTQANAKADHQTTLSDMQQDFTTTMQQATTDHGIALQQMTTAYQQQQQRAGEDLTTTFNQYTGGLNDSITQMSSQATALMEQYAPGAAEAYSRAIIDSVNMVRAGMGLPALQLLIGASDAGGPGSGIGTGWQSQPGGPGNGVPNGGSTDTGAGNPSGQPGGPQASTPSTGNASHSPHAAGGIFISPQFASVSESGPELLLPLNMTGQMFMTKLMTASVKDAARTVGATAAAPSGLAGSQFAPISKFSSTDRAFFTDLVTQASKVESNVMMTVGKEVVVGEHQSQAALAAAIVKSMSMVVQAIHVEEAATRQVIQKTDASMSFAGAQIKVVAQDVNAMAKQLAAKAKLAKLTSPKK